MRVTSTTWPSPIVLPGSRGTFSQGKMCVSRNTFWPSPHKRLPELCRRGGQSAVLFWMCCAVLFVTSSIRSTRQHTILGYRFCGGEMVPLELCTLRVPSNPSNMGPKCSKETPAPPLWPLCSIIYWDSSLKHATTLNTQTLLLCLSHCNSWEKSTWQAHLGSIFIMLSLAAPHTYPPRESWIYSFPSPCIIHRVSPIIPVGLVLKFILHRFFIELFRYEAIF